MVFQFLLEPRSKSLVRSGAHSAASLPNPRDFDKMLFLKQLEDSGGNASKRTKSEAFKNVPFKSSDRFGLLRPCSAPMQ